MGFFLCHRSDCLNDIGQEHIPYIDVGALTRAACCQAAESHDEIGRPRDAALGYAAPVRVE